MKGEVKPLSYDHKPSSDSELCSMLLRLLICSKRTLLAEKARITAAGGYIEYGRVNGEPIAGPLVFR